jgi:hypothetical protein
MVMMTVLLNENTAETRTADPAVGAAHDAGGPESRKEEATVS